MALIQYLTQIQFEFGAIQLLRGECARIGIERPLIVTDAGVRAVGILQKALDALGDMPVSVFDQTPSNPTEAAVRAAVGRMLLDRGVNPANLQAAIGQTVARIQFVQNLSRNVGRGAAGALAVSRPGQTVN